MGHDEVDYSRFPAGEEAMSRLMRAVSIAGDSAERHSLEIKGSRFDVTSKKDKSKIAKFILGAANRDPEIAKRHFQGYALMLIGVDDHAIGGVDRIEKMEIDKVVRPFLGASGPKWDIQRLPADTEDKEVLVIIVDPPVQGQPAFPCRSDGEGLKNGAIYFRADGSTRDAVADEVDMLTRRGRQQSTPIDLQVKIKGGAHRTSIDRTRTLDAYITATERSLLAALPEQASKSAKSLNEILQGGGISSFMSIPDSRTQKEYREEIIDWKRKYAAEWGRALDNINGWILDPFEVVIKNTTKANLKAVRVTISMDGTMMSIDHRDDPGETSGSDVDSVGLPKAPAKWGKRGWGIPSFAPSNMAAYLNAARFQPSISTAQVNGQLEIQVDAGDIRPLDTYTTEESLKVLLAPDDFQGDSLNCTWRATVENFDEVFEGELTIPVEPVKDMTQVARYLLGLDHPPKPAE